MDWTVLYLGWTVLDPGWTVLHIPGMDCSIPGWTVLYLCWTVRAGLRSWAVRELYCSGPGLDFPVPWLDCSGPRLDCSIPGLACFILGLNCSGPRLDCSITGFYCSGPVWTVLTGMAGSVSGLDCSTWDGLLFTWTGLAPGLGWLLYWEMNESGILQRSGPDWTILTGMGGSGSGLDCFTWDGLLFTWTGLAAGLRDEWVRYIEGESLGATPPPVGHPGAGPQGRQASCDPVKIPHLTIFKRNCWALVQV
jgi:hypothetical protein